MFEKITQKVAEKMGRSVRTTIEPIQHKVKSTVDNKVDLYSRVLRLLVLIILFIEGTRKVSDISKDSGTPNQIVINNYLTPKKEGEE